MGNIQQIQGQTINHPKLGQVVPIERYGKQYIVYTYISPPNTSLESWEEQLNKLSNAKKDCLFLPETYTIGTKPSSINICCGQAIHMSLTYQNYMYLLHEEIQNRKRQKKYYTEPDLWFMLYHMLSGANEMDIRNITIGDIRPKNILLDQSGTIKMINRMSWPGEQSGFQKVINKTGEKCFLAPEEMKALKNISLAVDLKSNKVQSFSIGITMLQLALLEESQILYDFDSKQINIKLLQSRLQKCEQRYSSFFVNCLKIITNLDAKQRATSGQCWSAISPYGEAIDNVLPFVPDRKTSQKALDGYLQKLKSGRV